MEAGAWVFGYTYPRLERNISCTCDMFHIVPCSFICAARENGYNVGQYDWDYAESGMNFLSNGGFACVTQICNVPMSQCTYFLWVKQNGWITCAQDSYLLGGFFGPTGPFAVRPRLQQLVGGIQRQLLEIGHEPERTAWFGVDSKFKSDDIQVIWLNYVTL